MNEAYLSVSPGLDGPLYEVSFTMQNTGPVNIAGCDVWIVFFSPSEERTRPGRVRRIG